MVQAQEKPYNQWSLDLGVGGTKIQRDFAPGYFMSTLDFPQVNLGIRHMFNSRFGLRLDLGYENLLSDEEDGSLPFDTKYYRSTVEGVINLGNTLNFSNWTSYLNLLAHGGAGYSQMRFDAVGATEDPDHLMNWVVGITPQLMLSKVMSLNADFSMVGNMLQNSTYDGTRTSQHVQGSYDATMMKISLGLSISLGSKGQSADFYPHNEAVRSELDILEERLAKMEAAMLDDDEDGVPNYLDQEPNTVSGMTVNTKGVAVDKNGNGIPDELELSLDAHYASIEAAKTGKSMEELLGKGYMNLYFDFNSDQPATYSLNAIQQLLIFLGENTEAEAELLGFTDKIGTPEINLELSNRRAKNVYDILVSAGVDPDRLSFRGMGQDHSLDSNSSQVRQLARRVTILLKE